MPSNLDSSMILGFYENIATFILLCAHHFLCICGVKFTAMHSCVFEEILIYANTYINYKYLVLRALNKDSGDSVAALSQTVSAEEFFQCLLTHLFLCIIYLVRLVKEFFCVLCKQDVFIWMTK